MKQIISMRSVVSALLLAQCAASFFKTSSQQRNAAEEVSISASGAEESLQGAAEDHLASLFALKDKITRRKLVSGRRRMKKGKKDGKGSSSSSMEDDDMEEEGEDGDDEDAEEEEDVSNSGKRKGSGSKSSKKSRSTSDDGRDDVEGEIGDTVTVDFSSASARNRIVEESVSIRSANSVNVQATIPKDTTLSLVVDTRRALQETKASSGRALEDLSQYKCPPDGGVEIDLAGAEKVDGGAIKVEYTIPGDKNSNSILCDKGKQVIGLLQHTVFDPTTPNPTPAPIPAPTTPSPTPAPTPSPTTAPTPAPQAEIVVPTGKPTPAPQPGIVVPTGSPSAKPSTSPSETPSVSPAPSKSPSPSSVPSTSPSASPAPTKTKAPTPAPTNSPTKAPTPAPTNSPTKAPTPAPTNSPTKAPTPAPTSLPTKAPTPAPTSLPTKAPTLATGAAVAESPDTIVVEAGVLVTQEPGFYDNYAWSSLPSQIQIAAVDLGYDQTSWDGNLPTSTSSKYWSQLTAAEQTAAAAMFYDEESWNEELFINVSCQLTDTWTYADIPSELIWAVNALGYTSSASWDSTDETQWPPAAFASWSSLTEDEQVAAQALGYGMSEWNYGCSV